MTEHHQTKIIRQVRQDLGDSIEDIGQAMGLLREAIDDAERDCIRGAQLCASDVVDILSGLELKMSQLTATLCKFADSEEEEPAA